MTRLYKKCNSLIWLIIITFLFNTLFSQPVQADVLFLPAPGRLISLTPAYSPSLILGLKVFKNNPFKFEIIMSQGDGPHVQLKQEADMLVKYFLASLTVPEKDMWVNLSPWEHNRIIPKEFGITEMGKELLAQDYLLKQVTASVMYPEGNVGREFWSKIYQEAYKRFGTTNIPVNTFNKVWIVPDTAVVYENAKNNTAVIIKSKLKVMLEEDYLALRKGTDSNSVVRPILGQELVSVPNNKVNALGSQIIREIIIPRLSTEVNEGKNFAVLRQVYDSLILAFWYKNKLKQSLISKGYVDRKKINGIDVEDKDVDQKIYRQYLKSYKKGVYNYIKEEIGPDNEVIPRKYFSGGVAWGNIGEKTQTISGPDSAQLAAKILKALTMSVVTVVLSATFAWATPTAASAQQSFDSIGGQIIQRLADNNKDTHIVVGSASKTNAYNLISTVIHQATGKIQLGQGGINELVKHGLIKIDGKTVTHLNQVLAQGKHVVLLDLDGVRKITSSATAAAPPLHTAVPVQITLTAKLKPTKAQVDFLNLMRFYVQKGGPLAGPEPVIARGVVTVSPVNEGKEATTAIDKEIKTLKTQIAQHKAEQKSPAEIKAQEKELVETYHLTVPTLKPVPLPNQTQGVASPIATFSPDAVGIAYIDYQLAQMDKLAQSVIGKPQSPITVQYATPMINKPYSTITQLGKGAGTFNLVLDVPGGDLLNESQILQGMLKFNTLPLYSQIAGPAFGAQILLNLRNYGVTHPGTGQGIRYDARIQNPLSGLLQSATIQVTPIVFYDKDGHKIEQYLYNVGAVQTIKAALGKLDLGLGNLGIVGNSSDHFPFENLGYQLSVIGGPSAVNLEQAFAYKASVNTDPDTIYYKVYNIEDTKTRFRKNENNGWDDVSSTAKYDSHDDFYSAKVEGFALHRDPTTGKVTGERDYTSPTFVTREFAERMTEQVTGKRNFSKDFVEIEHSKDDLKLELTLLKGVDANNHIIWGVLRDPLSGRIVKFITNPADLNNTSSLIFNNGKSFKFVPGKPTPAPSGMAELAGTVHDYFYDEFARVGSELKGMVKPTTVAEKYNGYKLSGSPLAKIPYGLQSLLSGKSLIVGSSPALDAIKKISEKYDGTIIFNDGNSIPALLTNMEHVRTLETLDESNGVTKSSNGQGLYDMEGLNKDLQGNTLVLLDANGKAVGIINLSDKLKQERLLGLTNYGIAYDVNGNSRVLKEADKRFIPAQFAGEGVVGQTLGSGKTVITEKMMVRVENINGKNTVVEIEESGKKSIEEHQVVETTLEAGGFEAEDQRTGSVTVFAKGNNLTAQQKALGIHSEKDLVELVKSGQARTVPVEGTDKQRWIILKEAPRSILNELQDQMNSEEQHGFNEQTFPMFANLISNSITSDVVIPGPQVSASSPFNELKIDTLTGPDGQAFHGVTIDTEMFRTDDIAKLNNLGATAVRTYYPIPVDIAQKLVAQSKVKTIIVGIPLDSNAYAQENLANYWGKPVPSVGTRISLEDNNYLPYLRQLTDAFGGKVKIIVDLGNELNFKNNYPAWKGKPDIDSTYIDLFTMINQNAQRIKASLGSNVTTSFTLGDRPEQIALALKTAPDIDVWGINYYRHSLTLANDVTRAMNETGIHRPFYMAEAGIHTQEGPKAQGEKIQADVDRDDWERSELMGQSIVFHSLTDNPRKRGDHETAWGLYDQYGNPKPVVKALTQAWGEIISQTPVDTSDNTLAGLNKTHALVRLKSGKPGMVLISDLDKLAPALERSSVEILQLDDKGETIGRYVKMFGSGYKLWKVSELEENMNRNFQIVLKDGMGAEYISLDLLKIPQVHEAIRKVADEINMMDTKQKVTARVYLNRNINGSRVEVLGDNNTSLIFELPSFFPLNLSNPVAKTISFTDSNGLLHVITTDLREANPGVVVEDAYQPVADGKPILVYSDRYLQKERIYFKNGHEQYSVSLDTALEPGQIMAIDGKATNNVTGIYKFDATTNSGYHVSLRELAKNGWMAPVRFTRFADGQTSIDQTGFVKLEAGLSDEQIWGRVKNTGVLNMKDVYSYTADGQFDNRVISFMSNGNWHEGWTLKGGYIGPQGEMINQLRKNERIAEAFDKYKLNSSTILIETIKKTPDGVISKDYRISGDVQEKKMYTVIEQDGVIVNIIVGLDFDARTGEQISSFKLLPDMQVESLSRTMPNQNSFKQLLPKGMEATYARFMEKRLGVSGADLWEDLLRTGVAADFKPVLVEEIPFIIKTDKPNDEGYKLIKSKMDDLINVYNKANNADRGNILDQISDLVREYHRDINTAHYTSQQGPSNKHYLAPPNDSRGKDFLKMTSNGDVVLDLWWLQGTEKFPANILPASIVVDNNGNLRRTMVFKDHSDTVFKNEKDERHKLGVNVYSVFDDPSFSQLTFTSLGKLASAVNYYERIRVGNGVFGVETRGNVTFNFDPNSPYPLPLFGTLDEDNRITKIILDVNFGVNDNGSQNIIETSIINEPTAPGIFKVKREQIIEGKPVPGTLKELDVWSGYWNELTDKMQYLMSYTCVVFLSFMTGAFFRNKKFERLKKNLSEMLSMPESEETGGVTPSMEAVIINPSFKAYGRSPSVVKIAKEEWEGTVLSALKSESMDDILKEQFNGYLIWRKEHMNIDEPFQPTVEDLWIKILIVKDCDIFNSGIPSGLNYLVHRSIEEVRRNPNANIDGFIKKTYTLFHDIIEWQHTTFQGLSGGDMKHVVPADYYINTDDIEDWFRTKEFVDWFDQLGFSFDGEKDLRSAIYNDFTHQLKEKVNALKAALLALAPKADRNVFKMKRRATDEGVKEAYQDYVNFFNSIKDGKFELSREFSFQGISRQEAMQRINGKPLIYKTAAAGALPVGKVPFIIRMIKPVSQLVRNSYKQLRNNIFLTAATGLVVASYNGYITAGGAALTTGVIIVVAEILNRVLNFWLDRGLNINSHGKPKPIDAGYTLSKPTLVQKLYRLVFWSLVISLKVVWDGYLIQKFLIPNFETLGANYFPFGSPINLNPLLMIQQWTTGAMFLFVFAWASNYLVITPMSHIYEALQGVGTIKSRKDIRALIDKHLLTPLIIDKLFPKGVAGLRTAQQKSEAVQEFITNDFNSHRSRDDAGDKEGIKIKEGYLDQYTSASVEYRKTKSVNSLVMVSPAVENFDDIVPSSLGIPVYAEDTMPPYKDIKEGKVFEKSRITGLWNGQNTLKELVAQGVLDDISETQVKIKADLDLKKNIVRSIAGNNFEYLWEKVLQDRNMPTALDMWLNTGYTNLNWFISRTPDRWENLIERVDREGIASPGEIRRMKALLTRKGIVKPGKLGAVNEDLEREIRLWAAYGSQPFARTLDGVMNIVRVLQFYAKLAHPDWSKEKIQKEVNKKFQFIWAYQIWGDILKATPDQPDLLLKKKDTEYLVKKYYDELGFIIDITSLEVRNGISCKVLYRYNPNTGKMDEDVIEETQNRAIVGEGKAYNQEKGFSFVRNGILGLWDMNMDLDYWEAANIVKLLGEFKDKKVGLVNFPEIIASSGFSLTATSLADSDENFSGPGKGHMALTHSPMHHGHPDFVRVSASRESGGVSSGLHVSEDYAAGLKMHLRGFKMIQIKYAKAIKNREYSWFGSLGMFTKFAMGGAQILMSRYSEWRNKSLGPINGAAEFYTGPAFYLLQAIATLGFFQYLVSVMIFGISPFSAISSPLTTMLIGVGLVGQALTFGGFSKMVLEDGFRKAFVRFFVKSLYFIAPLFIAHMFSYQAGFLSGLAGLAAYIATGRGYFREHVEIDKMFKVAAKSHTLVGLAGLILSAYGYSIWQNSTFFFSSFTIISFLFPLAMPFFLNPGTYPVNGVTWKKASDLYKSDLKLGPKEIKKTIADGWNQKDYRKVFIDSTAHAITYGVWFALTSPVGLYAGITSFLNRGKLEEPSIVNMPMEMADADLAMATKAPGGIDLGRTLVQVESSGELIQTAFDDPAMLRLLLNADGLTPIIYDIKTMSPSMVNHFVGLN